MDNPPWKTDPNFPRVIQTDESAHQAYALDYPGSQRGVILVSYVWNDKSTKIEGLSKERRLEIFRKQIRKASPEFAECMNPVEGKIYCIDWQREPYQNGAFKLDHPSQAKSTSENYFQFQSVRTQDNKGIYLAGDGVSNNGGWVVGAMDTGFNAACAAFEHIGGVLKSGNPLEIKNRYTYDS